MISYLFLALFACSLLPPISTYHSIVTNLTLEHASANDVLPNYNLTFYVTPNTEYNRIIFNNTFYQSGRSGNYTASNYTAWADLFCNVRLGDTCYFFLHWSSTGGLRVALPWHNPTTVTVNGSGSLTEID